MDSYEATRIVFTKIQTLDPEHASKIMGLLLIQDHGEKGMIRLAFGPESLLHSIIIKARKQLGISYAETVKLVLAKGNPHFVCEARVLVKPYKEKGKVPDRFWKQPQLQMNGPIGYDPHDPFDLQLGMIV